MMRTVRFCSLVLALSSAAHAATPTSCVVVRKPTAEQRLESVADVERLLDAYEAKTNDSAAWPGALADVFDRFPLPSVNMLMALNHPAWAAPEKKLVAYVEATRQDPGDYAEPAAVAKTVERIEQTLLPEVRHWPLLIVEVRGVARRQEIAALDIHIGNEACTGELIWSTAPYPISWMFRGRRVSATVSPPPGNVGDRCIAIDGDTVGPCDGMLRPVEPPASAQAPPKSPPPAPKPLPPAPPVPPSLDYRFAIPGLALSALGFGVAAYASSELDLYMDRAEGGCHGKQCSPSGMSDVVAAQDWKAAYYVAGASGLLGVGALVASGHRYYVDWFSPSPRRTQDNRALLGPTLLPLATQGGAGLAVEGRF
jgi:hypothetical protein